MVNDPRVTYSLTLEFSEMCISSAVLAIITSILEQYAGRIIELRIDQCID